MGLVLIRNASKLPIAQGTVVAGKYTAINLLNTSPLPSGVAINETISKFPRLAAGRVRYQLGAGGGPIDVQQFGSDLFLGLQRNVPPLHLPGMGTYFWPPGRASMAYALSRLSGPAPGAALSVELLSYVGDVAQDGEVDVLGIVQPGLEVPNGGLLILVSAGLAFPSCSGGWDAGEQLVPAAAGALRRVGLGETAIVVATAQAKQSNGDQSCPVIVSLPPL